jgi:hypothetical protein
MSEYTLYLGTAILLAVSILVLKPAFSEPQSDNIHADAWTTQQQQSLDHSSL